MIGTLAPIKNSSKTGDDHTIMQAAAAAALFQQSSKRWYGHHNYQSYLALYIFEIYTS